MYRIIEYGAMIADDVRMNAFIRALGQSIRPGSVVLDIGTGTGIFALLACRLGARRVFAIEPDDAIQVAREIAAANGYADRIEFFHAMSTDVALPERADVIVADIGGVLPWFQRHIPSIADARRRFLAPGGTLIPQRDAVWAAIVEAPDLYARHTGPWTDNAFRFDMEAARRIVVNTWSVGMMTRNQLLADPQCWATVDYTSVEDPDVRGAVSLTVARAGTGHGILAGFDRIVSRDARVSNAPNAPDDVRPTRIYPNVLFPWPAPVALAPGDHVRVELAARLVHDNYIWSWESRILDQGPDGAEKAHFRQSTFFGAPLSPEQLHKRSAGYAPALNEEGRIARCVLEMMSAGVTLGDIAARLSTEFPSRFPHAPHALSYVGDLASQYG